MARTKEACLICGSPLQYFEEAQTMECTVCHQSFQSNVSCIAKHYVCDHCHMEKGLKVIEELCLNSDSKNPLLLMQEIMQNPYLYMHGPEHHVLVGASLLTCYYNCCKDIYLPKALDALIERSTEVPGGICGFWGCCGAAVSTGIFTSVITEATPLSTQSWGLSNLMTSEALAEIARLGGPRCCKRNSFTAVLAAVRFVKQHFNIEMELPSQVVCDFYSENKECLGRRCPYFKVS